MALEQSAAAVIETGAGQPGVDALLVLGQGYVHLAEVLVAAPLPPGMDAGVAEQYRLMLQDRADMLRLKAESSFEAGLAQCLRLGLYGETLTGLQGALYSLDPERHGPALEQWDSRMRLSEDRGPRPFVEGRDTAL